MHKYEEKFVKDTYSSNTKRTIHVGYLVHPPLWLSLKADGPVSRVGKDIAACGFTLRCSWWRSVASGYVFVGEGITVPFHSLVPCAAVYRGGSNGGKKEERNVHREINNGYERESMLRFSCNSRVFIH